VEDDFGGSFKGSVRVDNGQDSRLAPSSMANEVFVLDSEADLDELEQHQHQKQIERRPSLSFHILADLDRPGSSCVVARGGRGGLGTAAGLAMSRRRRRHHGPVFAPDAHRLVQCAQGEPGEVAFLELELKLVGDVGLVGLPNAGKSSILAAISRAQPKVAPYPFTTLHPVVGVVEYRDGFRMRVADIPGLIEGASIGRGMGLDFLRHVERTRALLYVLDVSSYLNYSSSHEMTVPDPVRDLRTLVEEIEQYDESLLSRPCIVAANKVDLLQPQPGNDVVCRGESYDRLGYDSRSSDETNQNEIQRIQELLRRLEDESQTLGIRCESRVVGTSGVTGQGLAELASMIRTVVEPPRDDADDNDGERLGG
jgi:Obg family GTPase CgtA